MPFFSGCTHLPTSKGWTAGLAEQLVEEGFAYGLESRAPRFNDS